MLLRGVFKTVSKFRFNATFGYRILGNPSGIIFHNVLYGAAGMGCRSSSDSTIGTSFNVGQSPLRLQDNGDLTFYLSHRVSDRFRIAVCIPNIGNTSFCVWKKVNQIAGDMCSLV